jgi:hypothetical protein
MNQKLNIPLIIAAGLLGSLFTRYMSPTQVAAQNPVPPPTEIRAQSFTLVDAQDHAVGTFAFESSLASSFGNPGFPGSPRPQSRIVLRDSTGREIWSASANPIRQLSQRK